MTALTLISPYIRPFFGESQNLLVFELLYPGFENQRIFHGVPYVSDVERVRYTRVIPVMVGGSSWW